MKMMRANNKQITLRGPDGANSCKVKKKCCKNELILCYGFDYKKQNLLLTIT